MSHPTRTTYEYVTWNPRKGPLAEWLDQYGECGFRLVALSTNNSQGEWDGTAVMERRIESDETDRLLELNAELLQRIDAKNDELRSRLDVLEASGGAR